MWPISPSNIISRSLCFHFLLLLQRSSSTCSIRISIKKCFWGWRFTFTIWVRALHINISLDAARETWVDEYRRVISPIDSRHWLCARLSHHKLNVAARWLAKIVCFARALIFVNRLYNLLVSYLRRTVHKTHWESVVVESHVYLNDEWWCARVVLL